MGFDDVAVHSRRQATFLVAFHGVGGHGDDRQVSAGGLLPRADDPGGLETIHVGHLHIHQDQIESAGARLVQGGQRFSPVPGDDHRVAALSEQPRGDQLVDLVVLGQENAQLSPAFAQGVTGDRR